MIALSHEQIRQVRTARGVCADTVGALLTIRNLVIPSGNVTAAESVAREFLQLVGSPQMSGERFARWRDGSGRSRREPRRRAMWLGSSGALATLGLEPGTDVSPDRLALALQGRHARTREHVRAARMIDRQPAIAGLPQRKGRRDRAVTDKQLAVIHLDFALAAPELAAEVWTRSGPEQRATIERALLAGAQQAIAHMALGKATGNRRGHAGDREAGHGMAAVAAVRAVAQPGSGQAAPVVGLEVRGLLLGVQRADEKLVAVDRQAILRKGAKREAEELARGALGAEMPWLAYSGKRAAAAVLELERRSAATPGNTARERVAEPPSRPIGGPHEDPLELWRECVGDRRAHRIGERADELSDRLAALDDVQLLARRRALTGAFRPPDRAAARQALSLERDVAGLEESANVARRNAVALQRDAAGLARRERANALQAITVMQRRIVQQDSERARLLQTDDRRRARNRLDDWMNTHTEQAAQLVAVDRHLAGRLYRRVASDVDRAVLDTPDHPRTTIGGAPNPSAGVRDEWAALTSRLVSDQHLAAAGRAASTDPRLRAPRKQRELDARAQSPRAQRRLEQKGRESTIEEASVGMELGA
jgi:hypothetical protein